MASAKPKIVAPRTSCTGGTPNNLPPLGFHSVHGENVRISRDGSIARRVESFCKGVAFSARPVRVNEKVGIYLHRLLIYNVILKPGL
ncbi:protein neuralized-like isoform X3 [Ostrinia furnacalis]|uniref:protein neuralized-like isoform X3 n=1 Tax=Ostrinia furnacalis TaxID=93504 RepID=UPI00103CA124|nr:protein neuralized-like isoform X3 [Ostrinia furnacalis]